MIETLAQIDGKNGDGKDFTAGIVLWDDVVIEAAPIVQFMKRGKWSRDRVREHCKEKRWAVTVVWQREHPGDTTPQIIQHEESFEVRGCGKLKYFYFDDNAGRRAVTGRVTKEKAFAAAQAYLRRATT